MKDFSQHGEWLSLMDVSGPFLAEPVLKQVFPQGLEQMDSLKRRDARQAYDEWREAIDTEDPEADAIHKAWIDLVLKQILDLDEDGEQDILKPQELLQESLTVQVSEHGITIRPDYAVIDEEDNDRPLLLIKIHAPNTELDTAVKGDHWTASPAERMVELCRACDARLGLVTNGEQWMLVDAPVGGVTTFASWYARLWGQEPITLQAFVNLLGIRRFLAAESEQLPALLDESLKLQDEVTDALGEQVQRAVEVLIQALDRADVDRNRELLAGVEPPELYEAALTVMMRIVFMLSAEERGLLLLGDEIYESNYAVSTLRLQLRTEAEEILERRQDAWSRLLSIFRAVYGGIEHEALSLPALGGSLFDPDRFPFLEGRTKGTSWKTNSAAPLPIDNRTVLLLLDAVQLFQGRALSYRALDVEQIGYVYEGLLERTAVRASKVTLGLDATKSAKRPWVTLDELKDAADQGEKTIEVLLRDRTGSSISRVKNDLKKTIDETAAGRLLTACHSDQSLWNRVKPYLHFLRMDPWGYPLVYPEGTFMVTTGADRRDTATHYTPKFLTESIIKETLETVVYVGPAKGEPRERWKLISPDELLEVKICDPAMGSGAFLVQACRWLSERLVEAWQEAEDAGRSITTEGKVVDEIGSHEPLSTDLEEKIITARRLIAERCLYGVDMNPIAVELAKLSIWLVTLAKGRPFGFLDHNLRCGDSLLGIHDLEQLHYLDMKPSDASSQKLFASKIDMAVEQALTLRSELRDRPIRDIRDVQAMARLDGEARQKLDIPQLVADRLVGADLESNGNVKTAALSIEVGEAINNPIQNGPLLTNRAQKALRIDLPLGKPARRTFHWPLEFPEVFKRTNPGFDAMVGNPPFLGGRRISTVMGPAYNNHLIRIHTGTNRNADIVAHFFRRSFILLRDHGSFGLLATNSIAEGDTRQGGLEWMLQHGATIYAAYPDEPWPGAAAVVTSRVHVHKAKWYGSRSLLDNPVSHISAFLSEHGDWSLKRLKTNKDMGFQGTIVLGMGFVLPHEQALRMLDADQRNVEVIFPYLNGQDLNNDPKQCPTRWVINFWDWPEERASTYTLPYEWILKHVYPERVKKSEQKSYRNIMSMWWLHWNARPVLYHTIGRGRHFEKHPKDWIDDRKPQERVLIVTRVSKTLAFSFVPASYIFSDATVVFSFKGNDDFALLQSSIHTAFAWQHASRLKSDLRYSPTDALEPFPFPVSIKQVDSSALNGLGSRFHAARSELMSLYGIGLTKLYNRFHDRADRDVQIEELRQLFCEIDETVARAYGWDDLDLSHDFHEVAYLPENNRMRFTISEPIRIEILRRLAELNRERYEQEQTPSSQVRAKDLTYNSTARSRSTSSILKEVPDLFDIDNYHGLDKGGSE